MWVASNQGVNLYNPETDNFTRFQPRENDLTSLTHRIVKRIYEDHDGNFWMGTDGGLNRKIPGEDKFERFQKNENNPKSIGGTIVQDILQDYKGDLWVGFQKSGISRLNLKTKEFENFVADKDDPNSLHSMNVQVIYEDMQKRLWIGTGEGIIRYDHEKQHFVRYPYDNNDNTSFIDKAVLEIEEDAEGKLWFAVDGGGILVYNESQDNFTTFNQQNAGLMNNNVRSVFSDNRGGLWFGHYPGGVTVLDRYASAFKNFQHSKIDPNTLDSNDIEMLMSDSRGNLWVSTARCLNYLDLQTGRVTRYKHDPNREEGIPSAPIIAIQEDYKGAIWLGMWTGGLGRFYPETNTYIPVPQVDSPHIWSILEDSQNRLWINSVNGLKLYNRESDTFKTFVNESPEKAMTPVNTLHEDADGVIWGGSNEGLLRVNPIEGTYQSWEHDPDVSTSIGIGWVASVFADSAGYVWVGTGANGLNRYDKKTDTFKRFDTKDGLGDQSIDCIIEDDDGVIWVSTIRGLSKYDAKTERFSVYTEEHGLVGDLYKRRACVKFDNGDLAFGTSKGLSIFNPRKIPKNTIAPPIAITDFQLFNKSVGFGSAGDVLEKPIGITDGLTLTYKDSVFSFVFSALNYVMPEQNNYAYMLEGFDNDWIFSGHRRTTTYMNLEPGNYTFRVKGSNNENIWNDDGEKLAIKVLPPWWRTWWAYTLYGLIIISVIARVLYGQYRKRKIVEEQNRILEIKVAERTAEISKKNQDIQAMLSSMRQGLLTVEAGGIIHPEYSRFLEDIFECKDISGRRAVDFLFGNADFGEDVLDQNAVVIEGLIGEEDYNFEFNEHLLVKEVEVSIAGNRKLLTFDWNPIIVDGCITKLMVTVRDVTLLRMVEAEAETQRRELKIVGQIIKISNKKFLKFEAQTQKFLAENRKLLSENSERDEKVISLLFRNYHTIKGNCRTYDFGILSDIVHAVESPFTEFKQNINKEWHQQALLEDLTKVEACLAEYSHVFHEILGRDNGNVEGYDGLLIDEQTKSKIQSCIDLAHKKSPGLKSDGVLRPIQSLLDEAFSMPLQDVIDDILKSLPSIAEQLGKVPPIVNIDNGSVRFKNTAYDLLMNVFSHLLRNSLDHGLENTDEREKAGKPIKGCIDIGIRCEATSVYITLRDDGHGLNLSRLLQKGIETGRWQADEKPSSEVIANSIFDSGISTKELVSDISGRGVGMHAVKQFLSDHGADISLRFLDENVDIDSYVKFEISIFFPETLFIQASS